METDTPLMPDPHTPLRVVLEHATGPLAGLHQITGTTASLERPWPINAQHERGPFFGMVRVKRGGLYYKELVHITGLKTFNGAQV